MRLRHVVVTVAALGLAAASFYTFWTPTQHQEMLIPAISGPAR